ncbi:MAG: polysaccharide biosynthesis tyrosine autokinase [Alphaproteobacteria bacterium]
MTAQSNMTANQSNFLDFNLWDIVGVLWRRKWYLVAVVIAVNIASFFVLTQLTPVFEATAKLRLNPSRANVVDVDDVVGRNPVNLPRILTEKEIILSRRVSSDVIKKMDLSALSEFNGKLEPSWMFDFANRVDGWGGGKPTPYQPFEPGLVPGFDGPPITGLTPYEGKAGAGGILGYVAQTLRNLTLPDKPISEEVLHNILEVQFKNHLEVANDGRSYVLVVSFTSENARLSAEITNQIADTYLTAQLDAKLETTDRANRWLTDRIEELRDDVKEAEQAVEAYRSRAGLLKSTSSTLAESQVSSLNSKVIEARSSATEAATRIQQAEQAVMRPGGFNAVPEVLKSNLIQALRQQESQILRRKGELGREFGPMHPRMIAIEQEIIDLRTQIELEVSKILQGMRNEAQIANQRYATLASELDAMKRSMGRLNSAEVKLRALEREAAASRNLFETFLQRSRETNTQASLQEADASIISLAPMPLFPAYPNKPVIMILVFLASIGLGLALIIVAETLDSRFRSVQQLPARLGVRPLGMSPRIGNGKAADEVVRDPGSPYTEAIRRMLSGVQLFERPLGRPVNVMSITSVFPQEGKTSVSLSLARMAVKQGQKVLLIDLDLRRPAVARYAKMKNGDGVIEYFEKGNTLDSYLLQDKATDLKVLSAGTLVEDPIEALTFEKLNKLIDEARQAFDLVVIDTPPIGAAADALLIAQHVDACVLVARWNKVEVEEVTWAAKQIESDGTKLAGVFVTQADVKRHASYDFGDPTQSYNFDSYYRYKSS